MTAKMDEKMKAAFDAWRIQHRMAQNMLFEDCVEWTIDYLRRQQEPVGLWGQMPGTTSPEAIRVGWEPGYRPKNGDKLYANPIPSTPAVPEWQPIETAPKEKMMLLAAEFACEGDWRLKVGYFNVEDGSWKVFGASWEPTHWMPLPAAPQPKENSHD